MSGVYLAPTHLEIRSLNLGCGRWIMPGYVNLDIAPMPGVDIVFDLEQCEREPLPFAEGAFDFIFASHVLEHIGHPLPMMQELHRVASPGCVMEIRVPHGASDDAFEDPTHVRQLFPGSFGYFSQPYYWRADYGYRGDWLTERVELIIADEKYKGFDTATLRNLVETQRNIVAEMRATLRAVKPIREPKRDLQTRPDIRIIFEDT